MGLGIVREPAREFRCAGGDHCCSSTHALSSRSEPLTYRLVSPQQQVTGRVSMADDNDRVEPERERTTIIETGGGGGGGVLAVVLLIIVVLVLLFLFRHQLGFGGTNISVPNRVDVNVNSH